jgi:hypothetical protein
MSPRSPHVNVRMHRSAYDQLDQLTVKLTAELGRRLSLIDVLDVVITMGCRREDECAEMLKSLSDQA